MSDLILCSTHLHINISPQKITLRPCFQAFTDYHIHARRFFFNAGSLKYVCIVTRSFDR